MDHLADDVAAAFGLRVRVAQGAHDLLSLVAVGDVVVEGELLPGGEGQLAVLAPYLR